ncbi:DUF4422 domain-containing protein [Liquorilactobacillus cacaonum]|uniref:DUF4422 domain-containing protein n=1 Tax=Liquorilactobacillus cacaonum TaxID=483012 RepID=UPI00070B41E9|nr:DUF4422 domain-containing protein [Liquorilactobacillus cacaonum]
MKSEIYIVSHKDINLPSDDLYKPVQVGLSTENFVGFERDNTGINIARKNENYCELTVQYWAWKNKKAEIKGLVHYRRFFSNGKKCYMRNPQKKMQNILRIDKLNKLLEKYDMILPSKRNYYIETTWSHYEHSHHIKDLMITRDVISNLYPDYLDKFDEVMKRSSAHMFNMLIAKDEIFSNYSEWLFKILAEVEKKVDISDYSDFDKRIFGFISELLMDVWVEKNEINYTELPLLFIGKQNWTKKIGLFLLRKVGLSRKVI